MIRFKRLELDEVMPFIKLRGKKLNIEGNKVKTNTVRLLTFKNSARCVECGIEGTYFWVEKHHPNDRSYHLNLYATDKNGNEILMTKDHIIPKSKGGSNSLDNMQTMCCKCNQRKGNGDRVMINKPSDKCKDWVWVVITDNYKLKGREPSLARAEKAGNNALKELEKREAKHE
jgi:5-methylcytosine-specific restriction endonuclease McrA